MDLSAVAKDSGEALRIELLLAHYALTQHTRPLKGGEHKAGGGSMTEERKVRTFFFLSIDTFAVDLRSDLSLPTKKMQITKQ